MKKGKAERQHGGRNTPSLSPDDSRRQTKAGVSARIKTNELRVMAAVTLRSARHHKMAVKHTSLRLSLPQSSAVSLPLVYRARRRLLFIAFFPPFSYQRLKRWR